MTGGRSWRGRWMNNTWHAADRPAARPARGGLPIASPPRITAGGIMGPRTPHASGRTTGSCCSDVVVPTKEPDERNGACKLERGEGEGGDPGLRQARDKRWPWLRSSVGSDCLVRQRRHPVGGAAAAAAVRLRVPQMGRGGQGGPVARGPAAVQ